MCFDIKAFLYPYNSTMYIMLNFNRKEKNFKVLFESVKGIYLKAFYFAYQKQISQ